MTHLMHSPAVPVGCQTRIIASDSDCESTRHWTPRPRPGRSVPVVIGVEDARAHRDARRPRLIDWPPPLQQQAASAAAAAAAAAVKTDSDAPRWRHRRRGGAAA